MVGPKEKLVGLNPTFLTTLEKISELAGLDLTITESIPKAQGSHVKDSEHFKGLGVDVRVASGSDRFRIVQAALLAGLVRVGVYDKHVHLGADPNLPQKVVWVGVSK